MLILFSGKITQMLCCLWAAIHWQYSYGAELCWVCCRR